MQPIYLDYNATTPVDPAVVDAMLPYLRAEFGNPSSAHALGRRAHDAIEKARNEVATLIGASPDEIIFTSGGTEASNIAIRGGATTRPRRRTVVTTNIEHPATDACCALLKRGGHPVRRVATKPDGRIDPAAAKAAVRKDTALVTIIHAQNEIGTLQPVAEVARHARAVGALVHVDALGVDMLSIAGHKVYAPKGIGALYVRKGVTLPPLLVGAGQEHGRRPGTENVAYSVGLGEACRLARTALEKSPQIGAVADHLLRQLEQAVPGIVLVGHPTERLPNTLNV